MALVTSQPKMACCAAASSFRRLKASLYLGEYWATRCSASLEDKAGASRAARVSAAFEDVRRVLPETDVTGSSSTM